jgi:hypothetical protein
VYVNLAQPYHVLPMQMYAQMRYALQVVDAHQCQLLMEVLVMMAILAQQETNA